MTFGTASAASWTGDDATATNPALQYSVGGTVTGLSGSVVLQDNAGDDLTVNSNGPFKFATALANGAAYHVTVKTQPAGQRARSPMPTARSPPPRSRISRSRCLPARRLAPMLLVGRIAAAWVPVGRQ